MPTDRRDASGTPPRPGPAAPPGALVRQLLQTPEVRRFAATLAVQAVHVWAGPKSLRQALARLAGRVAASAVASIPDPPGPTSLASLPDDPQFVRAVSDQLAVLIDQGLEAMAAGARTAAGLDSQEKKRLVAGVLKAAADGRGGALLTDAARVLGDIHRADPRFFTDLWAEGIHDWLAAADFGELKEACTRAAPDLLALVDICNTALWQYPAKVVLLLSLLPWVANLGTVATTLTARRFNTLSPDLLADILLCLMREIDTQAVAGLVNETAEILRKVHTGSALLGEPGAPQLPRAAADMAAAVVARIDAATYWKARLAVAELAAVTTEAFREAAAADAVHARLAARYGPELTNIGLRLLNRRLAAWEDRDDDALAADLSRKLKAYDLDAAAEVVNQILRTAGRFMAFDPDLAGTTLKAFAAAIDADALAETAQRVFMDDPETFATLARPVVPGLVVWLCGQLQPRDDAHEPEAARAREALRCLLKAEASPVLEPELPRHTREEMD